MTLSLSVDEYKSRVTGCWLGKSIGGTLGMPYEGVRDTLSLTYYNPIPTQMVANDDLDAQVVYAFLLDRMEEPRVDRHVLAEAWQYIGMSADEYGICKRNLKLGLVPPLTGSYDNPFSRGMGAAIRTEIWACLAPGQPALAAAYAYEDACMDHAGDGIHAAVFIAALQSMAFVEHDRETLLDGALAYVPADSELRAAVTDARRWWAESGDWRTVQSRLSARYLTDNFTDVVINVAYIVLAWLAGAGEFGRSICAAVNAGQDTDCTGATLGALLGILDPDGVEEKWLTPIGRELVLSESIVGVAHPPTIDAFTDLMVDLRRRLSDRGPAVDDASHDTSYLAIAGEIGFADGATLPDLNDTPELPESMRRVLFPGQLVEWPIEYCQGEQVWVRYRVTLPRSQPINVLFNTPEPMRLWVDGCGILSRDGGPFVPAIHRAPGGQLAQLSITSGEHELVAVMRRPLEGKLTWCVGLSDVKPQPVENDWLVDVFDRVAPSGDDAAGVLDLAVTIRGE